MVGKKMEGTGLSDILLEAGLDQKLLPHTFVLPPLLLVLNNEGILGLPCYL
jgi:hypothetical protein